MGYYAERKDFAPKNKAEGIAADNGGICTGIRALAEEAMAQGKGVFVVVDNGPFEAAAFAYNEREFEEFHRPTDRRFKQYVIMDRKTAEHICRYS